MTIGMLGARARRRALQIPALLVVPVALLCAARLAQAAAPSVSYSTWIVSNDTVLLRFVLPAAEAERLSGSALPVLTVSKLGEYILDHTAVTASGRECPAIDQGYDLGKVDPVRVGPRLYGFEILFRCSEPMRSLVLVNHALFERTPAHVNFARVEVGKRFTDQLFTAGSERVHIADRAAGAAAGLGRYMGLGMEHVLRDLARLCFLVAAAIAAGRPRGSLEILGGLAAGYVLALGAQHLGLIASQGPLIEYSIGFLVALCAIAVIAPRLGRSGIAMAGWPLLLLALAFVGAGLRAPRPALLLGGAAVLSAGFIAAIRAGPPRAIMALPAAVFGFLDGFALPLLVAPLGLTFSGEARMAIGYDLGALLAEAGVLVIASAALALAAPRHLTKVGSRPAPSPDLSALRGTLAEVIAAAVFAGLGTFWLVSRLQG